MPSYSCFVKTRYNDGDYPNVVHSSTTKSKKEKFTEKEPTFSIVGSNEEGEFEINVERFFGCSHYPKKLIARGIITTGKVITGNKISLKFKNGESVEEEIKRIEVYQKEVNIAVIGEHVGLCLSKLSLRQLRRLNEKE